VGSAAKVSQNIFVAEYFPYHSNKYKNTGAVSSRDYAPGLIRQSRQDKENNPCYEKSGGNHKRIQDLRDYPWLYRVWNPKIPCVSQNNIGHHEFGTRSGFAQIASAIR